MKKLLSLLGALGLVASTGTAVIACGNINETVKNTKVLSDIVKTKNLGLISFKADKTEESIDDELKNQIINKINEKNEGIQLDSNNVWMSQTKRNEYGDSYEATITAKTNNKKVKGEVIVSFSVIAPVKNIVNDCVVCLNKEFTENDKSDFKDWNDANNQENYEIKEETLIKELRKEIPYLSQAKFDEENKIEADTTSEAWNNELRMGTAKVSIKNYTGEITVHYFIADHRAAANAILKNNELGNIKFEAGTTIITEDQIIEAIKEKNLKLAKFADDSFSIGIWMIKKKAGSENEYDATSATVKIKHFSGSVDVNFTPEK